MNAMNRADVRITPSGYLRADYILAWLERAVVRAHGQEAFEEWRIILAEKAVLIARGSKHPGLVHRLIELEKLWVKIVGEFTPEMWEYGRPSRRETR